jgi:hypothetical protein
MRPSIHARTSTPRSSGGIEESRIKPAWRDSSCSIDRASRSSSSATWRGLCIQRRRISAARGSVTARSLSRARPRRHWAVPGYGELRGRTGHPERRSPNLAGVPPPPVDARDTSASLRGLIVPAIAPRTYAATSVGSMEENDIKQACRRSSCSVESASRSSSGATGRGRCNQRKRISAARGSVTARSRRPRFAGCG